jgi:hypothetical protein
MLRFIDGFDHYATADLRASLKWSCTGTPTIGATSGRRGTGAVNIPGGAIYLTKTLGNQATWIVGFALYFTSMSYATVLLSFIDGTTTQCSFGIDSNGHLVFYRGNGATVLATSTNTLSINTWNYIELKVTISNAVGAFEARVDGSSTGWLSASSVDTCSNSNEYASLIRVGGISALASTFYLDDIYICDSTGSANNNFLGDCRVDVRLPNGNGNSSQFTNSDGNSTNNYQYQDDATPDGDTTYVQDSVVGHEDTYPIPALTHTPLAIFGVQPCVVAKKDDEGSRSVATVVRSGGTDYAGATQPLSTSYVGYTDIRETDPATGVAWTKSGVDSIEVGLKVAA